jgi:hypothetical protein
VRDLVGDSVPVYVESEKRLTISTGDLSPELRGQIEAAGAEITREEQYDLDEEP